MSIDKEKKNHRTILQFPIATFIWINGLEKLTYSEMYELIHILTFFNYPVDNSKTRV